MPAHSYFMPLNMKRKYLRSASAIVFYAVEHEAEVLAVCLCYSQMHVEVGEVDLGHPISAAEHACKRVSALHL